MSAIFEEMDRLAAEKYAEVHEETLDAPPRDQRAEEIGRQPVEEPPDAKVDRQHRKTSDTGAAWDATNYRYDLLPTAIVLAMLKHHPKAYRFIDGLFLYLDGKQEPVWEALMDLLGVQFLDLVHLSAQALHERTVKYGERKWERELSESELINHVLYHLFKLVDVDSTENHRAHLVWSVMTLVLLKVTEFYTELRDSAKETTDHD